MRINLGFLGGRIVGWTDIYADVGGRLAEAAGGRTVVLRNRGVEIGYGVIVARRVGAEWTPAPAWAVTRALTARRTVVRRPDPARFSSDAMNVAAHLDSVRRFPNSARGGRKAK